MLVSGIEALFPLRVQNVEGVIELDIREDKDGTQTVFLQFPSYTYLEKYSLLVIMIVFTFVF